MTRKVYRTAQGKMVDLGRLQLQNENTRAVGNMGVNARGDNIDSLNRPIVRRSQQVQKQYNLQTQPQSASANRQTRAIVPAEVPPPPEDFQDDFAKNQEPVAATGLAAAIAKAREVRQEPLKTPQQVSQQQEGVRKI